jgi:hypothetical protein
MEKHSLRRIKLTQRAGERERERKREMHPQQSRKNSYGAI